MASAASAPPAAARRRATTPARGGRPQKVDDAGVATRERLLAAAVAACVEHGFEGTTVADIADRAGVSAPAIYKHFGGKAELLVAAGRSALAELRPAAGGALTAAEVARLFLAPGFADTRRLLGELHLAALRHPDVAQLLAQWQREHLAVWAPRTSGRQRNATVKVFFAVLLGLCQLDALDAIAAPPGAVQARVGCVIGALFPDEGLADEEIRHDDTAAGAPRRATATTRRRHDGHR